MKIRLLLLFVLFQNSIFAQSQPPYIVFEKNNQYGVLDSIGNIIIQPSYQGLDVLKDHHIVANKNDLYGLFDKHLNLIIPFDYDYIQVNESEQLLLVSKNGKYGLLNMKGEVILPIIYEHIANRSLNNTFIIKKGDHYGVVNHKGKIILPTDYEAINEYNFNAASKNLYAVRKNGLYGYVNHKNKYVIPPIFTYASNFDSYGLATVNKDDQSAIMTKKGKIVLDYSQHTFNDDHIVTFKQNDLYGVFDKKSQKIIQPPIYESVENFQRDEAIMVKKNGLIGYIDRYGKLIIPCTYQEADNFSEGLAAVLIDGKWGYIDLNNTIVIPNTFIGSVGAFKNNVAVYHRGPVSKYGYTWKQDGLINRKGEIIAQPIYEGITYLFGDKAILVEKGDKFLYDFKTKKKLGRLIADDSVYQIQAN